MRDDGSFQTWTQALNEVNRELECFKGKDNETQENNRDSQQAINPSRNLSKSCFRTNFPYSYTLVM